MNQLAKDSELETSHLLMQRLTQLLQTTVIGQDALVEALVVGVFAQGHVLLEGAPGLGKTHLAKGLAQAMGYSLARIQCTPDLLPADVTGSESLQADGTLAFQPGPLFANTVLVDEINRATPRTQAAFLEAMQERQVTHLGQTRQLPTPFWMLATQNSIELEGTYPLPEAQLDRFLFKLLVPYPDAQSLVKISELTLDSEPTESIEPMLNEQQVSHILKSCTQVVIAPSVREVAVALILATQPEQGTGHVRYGASPRGLQGLLKAARVRALVEGRAHVALDDLAWVAAPVLRHRIILTFEAAMDGLSADDLVTELLGAVLERR